GGGADDDLLLELAAHRAAAVAAGRDPAEHVADRDVDAPEEPRVERQEAAEQLAAGAVYLHVRRAVGRDRRDDLRRPVAHDVPDGDVDAALEPRERVEGVDRRARAAAAAVEPPYADQPLGPGAGAR